MVIVTQGPNEIVIFSLLFLNVDNEFQLKENIEDSLSWFIFLNSLKDIAICSPLIFHSNSFRESEF